MGRALTGAERQKRWRERHPEKSRALARARSRKNNPRQVRVGGYYVGMAPTPEIATVFNQHARDHFARKEEAG